MNSDAHKIFGEYIKAAGLKETVQREIILNAFLSSKAHLSIEDIYGILAKSKHKVGFATIYRTMKVIADSGLAREVMFNDGVSRFEHTSGTKHHHHLICEKCQKVIEFSSTAMEKEEKSIASKFGFKVSSHHFKIFGTCKKCRNKKQESPNG